MVGMSKFMIFAIIVIAVVVGGGLFAYGLPLLTGVTITGEPTDQEPTTVQPVSCGFAQATATLTPKNIYNVTTPSAISTEIRGINGEGEGVVYSAETAVTTAGGQISATLPATIDAEDGVYLMVGNDNFVTQNDQGAEYYYTMKPLSWTCSDTEPLSVRITEESTVTWTGKDDGTVEASPNISVASGGTVVSSSLKLTSATAQCIGNREITNPIAVGFNTSGTGLETDFDTVRPVSSYLLGQSIATSKVDTPGFANGMGIINDQIYILDTQALCDGAEFEFNYLIDASASIDPVAGDSIHSFMFDKTYVLDDLQNWVEAWGDESDIVADTDAGIDTLNTNQEVGLT